jgi:hypothetical protein
LHKHKLGHSRSPAAFSKHKYNHRLGKTGENSEGFNVKATTSAVAWTEGRATCYVQLQ